MRFKLFRKSEYKNSEMPEKVSSKKATVKPAVKKQISKTNENKLLKNDGQNKKTDFLESFDWHNYKEGINLIENKQLESFEKLVKENFVDTSDDDVIEGEVIYMTEREAIIDINAKS